MAYLLPDKWLLDCRKIFEGRKEHMRVLWASDVLDKFA
jgi:hypothetical protein